MGAWRAVRALRARCVFQLRVLQPPVLAPDPSHPFGGGPRERREQRPEQRGPGRRGFGGRGRLAHEPSSDSTKRAVAGRRRRRAARTCARTRRSDRGPGRGPRGRRRGRRHAARSERAACSSASGPVEQVVEVHGAFLAVAKLRQQHRVDRAGRGWPPRSSRWCSGRPPPRRGTASRSSRSSTPHRPERRPSGGQHTTCGRSGQRTPSHSLAALEVRADQDVALAKDRVARSRAGAGPTARRSAARAGCPRAGPSRRRARSADRRAGRPGAELLAASSRRAVRTTRRTPARRSRSPARRRSGAGRPPRGAASRSRPRWPAARTSARPCSTGCPSSPPRTGCGRPSSIAARCEIELRRLEHDERRRDHDVGTHLAQVGVERARGAGGALEQRRWRAPAAAGRLGRRTRFGQADGRPRRAAARALERAPACRAYHRVEEAQVEAGLPQTGRQFEPRIAGERRHQRQPDARTPRQPAAAPTPARSVSRAARSRDRRRVRATPAAAAPIRSGGRTTGSVPRRERASTRSVPPVPHDPPAWRRVRILFSTSSFGFLRNFQSSIRRLAEQGHEIHLLAERSDTVDGQKMADALVAEHPDRITAELPALEPPSPLVHARHRRCVRRSTTGATSIPAGTTSPKLRARAASMAPGFARPPAGLAARGLARQPGAAVAVVPRGRSARCRRRPKSPRCFERERPDLLLLTPLLYFRSHQVDHVRYARAARHQEHRRHRQLGSPDDQGADPRGARPRAGVERGAEAGGHRSARRAGRSRRSSPGSQAYDHWFDMTAVGGSRRRSARASGSTPRAPSCCISARRSFIAPYEAGFVRSWIAAIRASADPWLRSAGLLVRPHPQNAEQWQTRGPAVRVRERVGVAEGRDEPDWRRRARTNTSTRCTTPKPWSA